MLYANLQIIRNNYGIIENSNLFRNKTFFELQSVQQFSLKECRLDVSLITCIQFIQDTRLVGCPKNVDFLDQSAQLTSWVPDAIGLKGWVTESGVICP